MKRTIVFLLCFALILSFSAPATATEAVSVETNTLTEKIEILAKRDVYSKTYMLPDGSFQYVSYAIPIHYKDSNGTYTEINNKITDAVSRDGYKYTNTANGWNAYFSEKIGANNAVMMTSGKYNIAFSFVEQTGTAKVIKATDVSVDSRKGTASAYYQRLQEDDRAVVYRDVVENVDIAYTVKTGALKEDIILKSKQAPSVFRFRLTTNGLTLKKSGNTLGLFAASGEEIFTFAPLYMEDANGKRSENVSLQFESVKNGYEVTVSADVSFLNDVDTAYPVVIDPSVMVTGSGVTYDTYVDLEYPNSNYYLSENLWTGGSVNSNVVRTYIKFDMPNGVGGSQVTSAYINIRKKDYQTPTCEAYRVASSWSSSAITWNSKPSFDAFNPSNMIVNTTGDWYRIDVTALTKQWLNGWYDNYGVVLKEPYETDSSYLTKLYSSDAPSPNKPELVIEYNEDYNVFSRTLNDVPTNLRSNVTHSCIPCAITNVAAYWSVNGYPQFGCTTASAQETVAVRVRDAMDISGSSGANDNITDGFSVFQHNTGLVTYGLDATNYWQDDRTFDFQDIVTEIDAGRPLLLGFALTADSPYNEPHMTACAGYEISGSIQYVFISDAHKSYLDKAVFNLWTYNDFIAKVSIIEY